jgi:hypothetical protein
MPSEPVHADAPRHPPHALATSPTDLHPPDADTKPSAPPAYTASELAAYRRELERVIAFFDRTNPAAPGYGTVHGGSRL